MTVAELQELEEVKLLVTKGQTTGVLTYSEVATAGILLLVNLFVPIRVAAPAEEAGLDLAQHGEIAYQP